MISLWPLAHSLLGDYPMCMVGAVPVVYLVHRLHTLRCSGCGFHNHQIKKRQLKCFVWSSYLVNILPVFCVSLIMKVKFRILNFIGIGLFLVSFVMFTDNCFSFYTKNTLVSWCSATWDSQKYCYILLRKLIIPLSFEFGLKRIFVLTKYVLTDFRVVLIVLFSNFSEKILVNSLLSCEVRYVNIYGKLTCLTEVLWSLSVNVWCYQIYDLFRFWIG